MTMTKLQYFSKDRNEDRRSQPHQPDGQPADSPLDGPQFHRAGRSERMSRRAHRQSFGDPAFDADPAEHPRPDDAAEHADHDYRHGRQGRNPPELADTDSAIAVVTDFGSSEATTAGSAPIQRAINATLTIPTALPTRIATTIEITFPRML